MVFMKSAPDGSWNSDTHDFFDDLEDYTLIYKDDEFMGMFWFLTIASLVSMIGFIVVYYFIQKDNPVFWFFEYIMFGVLFCPTVGNLSLVLYCDAKLDMSKNTDIECFDDTHKLMCVLGFFGISAALVMAAAIFPVLKAEREGVENRWENEAFFHSYHKLLLVLVITLLAPIQLPWVGILVHAVLIVYLAVFDCIRDLFVASIKMSVLFA
jgi:hypothetical protein